MNAWFILAVGLIAVAGLIMLHHFAKHGYWVDRHDVDNHETVAGIIAALGAGMLLGVIVNG